MAPLDKRERKNAAFYYFVTAFLTIAWWLLLILIPNSRAHFLGSGFAEEFTWILLAPDLISALVIAFLLGPYILRGIPSANALAWLHAGGQGYAFAISIGLTIIDPRAYWGLIGMAFSSGIAIFLAMRIQQFNILWGKFKFKSAPTSNSKIHWRRTLVQTAMMWSIFLALIPLLFAQFERNFHFDHNWFVFPFQVPLSVFLFLIFGIVGLRSGYVMTHYGDGTPLPAEHANKLVVLGPYRYVRNPMALCGIAQGATVGLAFGSSLIVAYSLLGAFAWEILVRPLEEEDLKNRFGGDYRAYQESVKCWIPSLRPYRQSR